LTFRAVRRPVEVLHDDDRRSEVSGQTFEDPGQRLPSAGGRGKGHDVERGTC
jgi:hypothetical protein